MKINLFHQCGHNTVWNKDSLQRDLCGNGLILSPIHQAKDAVESMDLELRQQSFFDPQFYLPSSQKVKLKTYDFFPETISKGFSTVDFTMLALEAARQCVQFQVNQQFNRVIIPARYFADMVPDYCEKQDIYTVHPFLQAIEESGYDGDVILTLPLTQGMIKHEGYRTNILNWVTKYPRINGVYILMDAQSKTKQIQDFELLKAYLCMVKELADVGLKVTIGHANTEGLLFSLIDGTELTFGAYENTRMFSIDKFVVVDEERRGPRARLYLPGLYNWILYSDAQQIRAGLPEIWSEVYWETPYGNQALDVAAEPSFNYPGLYKHFFISYQSQVDQLSELTISERYRFLRERLNQAGSFYQQIKDWPLDLERHGNGDHIKPWLDAINWFYREFIA
jgi:hypothetical protein